MSVPQSETEGAELPGDFEDARNPGSGGIEGVPETGEGGSGGRTGSANPERQAKPMPCARRAFGEQGVALVSDLVGVIPGEGQAVAIAQLVVAGAGFTNAYLTKDRTGAVGSILLGQVTMVDLAMRVMGSPIARAVPLLGNVGSLVSAIRDMRLGFEVYETCLGN